ncbi:rhomboid family intramembrane serine protease [Candidatus Dojkabacteria bacterium]|nr:rhomboid family intramembrane serine protease [Candidatus Dojkabacteria bacterium]
MKHIFEELKYGPTVTYILIIINILIFIFSIILQSVFTTNDLEIAVFMGGSNITLILQGQVWRLITANFLQVDILHLGFNVLSLYYYGKFIEQFYSSKKLFIIYLLSGIAGTTLSLLNFSAVSFGASAGIWGFLGVIVGNLLKKNTYSPGLPLDLKQLLPSVLIWLFFSFSMPGISGLGHLGGFIGGVILGLLLDTVHTFRPRKFEENMIRILFPLSIILTVLGFLGLIFFVLI